MHERLFKKTSEVQLTELESELAKQKTQEEIYYTHKNEYNHKERR